MFRVDNPHTKPVSFWEYLIQRVQSRYPDVVFLSEAFTRPKMMAILAKAGFTQSYTYFTWRNTKDGLTGYFNELTRSELALYFRPNLFANTPDILPSYLQFGGRPAFEVRAVLASTLSPVYGIYSGFELCENQGLEKKPWQPEGDVRRFLQLCDSDYKQLAKEEYIDSEKYQFKGRDWDAPGNIKTLIARLNEIRKQNPVLQRLTNLRFQESEHDLILAYARLGGIDTLFVVTNLNAWYTESTMVHAPIREWGVAEWDSYSVEDLITGQRYSWKGSRNFVILNPGERMAHIFRFVGLNA
jgi:starch synthase (maltosyl-transferring)